MCHGEGKYHQKGGLRFAAKSSKEEQSLLQPKHPRVENTVARGYMMFVTEIRSLALVISKISGLGYP